MTDFYLIKRPGIDASTSYQYKTDVLASYGNKEDRIAQRDIPRIGFSCSFLVSDLKEALAINSKLMETGNTGTVWYPDWTAAHKIDRVTSGTNVITAGLTNFASGQYGVLYLSDIAWTVVEVTVSQGNITFSSTVEYDNALLMPLYACDVIGEPEISQANSLCCVFSVSLECKRPNFSKVYEWGTKFLGHDVWTGFHVDLDSSELSRKSNQEIQENDYEIGVRDRFTFFSRTYNSFGANVICKESELPAFRNFIKRRWGMTYSFFIPSGMADFQKAGDPSDTVGSYLRIRNNNHDFSARPYIVIQTDETANYAHVIALQDDWGDPVNSDYSGEFITLVLEESFSFKYRDIDSVQILYFVRLSDDTVNFNAAGVSGENDNVYSSDLSFIETDFYDSSLIDYDDTWGSVKDLNTIYLFKVSATDAILENGDQYGYSIRNNAYDYRTFIVPGKYEGTYAVKTVTSSNCWILIPGYGSALIGRYEDFVFQIEGKFDEYEGNAERFLLNSNIPSYCIHLFRKNGYYWISIEAEAKDSSNNPRYLPVCIKMNRWLGDEWGWHEWAVQRHNGKLYFLCDGLLCGVSRDFYGMGYAGANYSEAINTPTYTIATHGTVQQFRLAKGLYVYHGETGIMNKEYRLNDYSLATVREFDNATVCIVDFKNFNDRMGQTTLSSWTNSYDLYDRTPFLTGNSERVRRAVEICENQFDYVGGYPSFTKNTTGLLINNSSHWCLHPNIHFEQRYYHDFWFEFTMVLSDDQSWSTQCMFPLRGIMVNIIISSGQYTVEACSLGSGIFVNIGEPLTFALGVSSQDNKIVTYVNGVRSGSINLDTYMSGNTVGYMSVYPMAIRKGGAVDSRSYYLHRLRFMEICLTTGENYTVADEWTLGDYHTVPFTMEYGVYGIDNTKILKLKNIESVHPIAPFFTSLRQSQTVDFCNKLWSDGNKRTEIVSPSENTFYKITLTDPKNGNTGYGWFYVYANYTGVLFESEIGSVEQYDPSSQQMKIVPIVRGKRYDVADREYKTYTPTVANTENIAIVPPYNNLTYNRIGNSLYFRGNSGYANYQFMIDFLGDSGNVSIPVASSRVNRDTSRWLNEHRIKQVEFVLNPPFNLWFTTLDNSRYRVYSDYGSRHMQMWTVDESNFDSRDLYSDVTVPVDARYGDYNSFSVMTVKSGCDYWDQWRQSQNKYNYTLGYTDATADPTHVDANWLWITQPQITATGNLNPVHVVIQFVMTNALGIGGAYAYSSIQLIEKVWVNGKEYKTAEQWWEQYKSKFSYRKGNVTSNAVSGQVNEITSLFKGIVEYYCKNFMEQAGTGDGAIWGVIYYGGNRQADGWTRYVSCIKAYENEHYNGDFDAEAVMKKLQDARISAVNIEE